MSPLGLITFSRTNRRMILLLVASHLTWCGVLMMLWSIGHLSGLVNRWWSVLFVALQLFAAAQLLLPALLLHAEERNRSFYLFWGGVLAGMVWLLSLISPAIQWQPLLAVMRSSLLLLVGTVIGAALARYIRRLWELIPVCLVMSLADFFSWMYGPTATFSEKIAAYYRAPVGRPPLIDLALVKLVLPGFSGLAPVFGISDWVMVVFFAIVARRHTINDNLIGRCGELLAKQGLIGRYLPVSVAALFAAILLAQSSGLFIPALPLIALIMLLWYGLRSLFCTT